MVWMIAGIALLLLVIFGWSLHAAAKGCPRQDEINIQRELINDSEDRP